MYFFNLWWRTVKFWKYSANSWGQFPAVRQKFHIFWSRSRQWSWAIVSLASPAEQFVHGWKYLGDVVLLRWIFGLLCICCESVWFEDVKYVSLARFHLSGHWEFSYRTLSSVAALFLRMLSIEVNNNVHALFILSSICRCFLFFVLLIALRERWDDLVIKFIFCFFLTSKQIKTLVKLSDSNQEKQPEQHKSLILWRKK